MPNSLKMPVACNQREVVFECERCNPKIVVWHGGARALELHKDPGIVFRSLSAREEHRYGCLGQEALQQGFIALPLGATVESSLDLAQTPSAEPRLRRTLPDVPPSGHRHEAGR